MSLGTRVGAQRLVRVVGAVVTEQGIAWMWGRDERQQARNLIEQAAHPSVRDDLWEEAQALGLA